MKILINWPPLRQLINYIRERFTFLVLLLYRVSSATYDAKRATENFRQLGAAAVYPVQHGDGVHLGSAALYESK